MKYNKKVDIKVYLKIYKSYYPSILTMIGFALTIVENTLEFWMEVGLCLSVQSIICNIPANVTIKWCQSTITMRYVEQGSVDQRADKAIQKISVSKTYCPFNQTEIYPVHSVILSLNNKVHRYFFVYIYVYFQILQSTVVFFIIWNVPCRYISFLCYRYSFGKHIARS